ncbi:Tfp pilus assembly protein PilN [Synechococcus sp. PCC 7502]|uniref:PilN domain-containing protein n=1 Tax=Synechococcus sp. PCC 7502 TaxID=1173263 RepID=UPI00029FEC21|nr:PilN domain-containing protein [Synechococcus sp. PCC 7502]AFY72748.1 Tfp pilus assembly protein PilN [Synechococcus sp. PCC 7502]
MYKLDINFLKDREPETLDQGVSAPIADSQFLIGGGAVALVALAIVGGIYFYLQSQVNSLQAELGQLTTKESALDAQLKVLAGSEAEVKAAEARTQTLASLITKDIPTSVVLQDIRVRTPETIQVFTIAESGKNLTITGQSTGFDEANDFLLVLQKSPYLDPTKTKLVSAKQKPPVKGVNITLVDYQITTSLTDTTTDKLVADLQKSDAQGAVSRVKLLQEKGVVAQ